VINANAYNVAKIITAVKKVLQERPLKKEEHT